MLCTKENHLLPKVCTDEKRYIQHAALGGFEYRRLALEFLIKYEMLWLKQTLFLPLPEK